MKATKLRPCPWCRGEGTRLGPEEIRQPSGRDHVIDGHGFFRVLLPCDVCHGYGQISARPSGCHAHVRDRMLSLDGLLERVQVRPFRVGGRRLPPLRQRLRFGKTDPERRLREALLLRRHARWAERFCLTLPVPDPRSADEHALTRELATRRARALLS